MAQSTNERKREFNRDRYLRLYADLPKEIVVEFKECVKERGESVAEVFRAAMLDYLTKHRPEKYMLPENFGEVLDRNEENTQ